MSPTMLLWKRKILSSLILLLLSELIIIIIVVVVVVESIGPPSMSFGWKLGTTGGKACNDVPDAAVLLADVVVVVMMMFLRTRCLCSSRCGSGRGRT
jgi:hypothetical protein